MPRTRQHSPVIDLMIDSWDPGDPFGSAMEAAWAVAVVSYAQGTTEAVGVLDYRPSPLGSPTWDDLTSGATEDNSDITIQMTDLADAYAAEDVSDEDLIFAAKVLSRYIGILKAAGKSY